MKILAADTSVMMGSVALVDNDKLVAESLLNVSSSHSERLLMVIDQLLGHARWKISDIDGFAVAIGPGSFTGLRIGLATLKGLAAATGKGLIGISSLLALAYNGYGSRGIVVPLLDAKRSEVYAAAYRFGRVVECLLDEMVIEPERLCEKLLEFDQEYLFLGDGVYPYEKIWRDNIGQRLVIPPAPMLHPRASNVAMLALGKFKRGEVADLAALVPNYIRKSDAERKLKVKG